MRFLRPLIGLTRLHKKINSDIRETLQVTDIIKILRSMRRIGRIIYNEWTQTNYQKKLSSTNP